jgi:hypothetical protein
MNLCWFFYVKVGGCTDLDVLEVYMHPGTLSPQLQKPEKRGQYSQVIVHDSRPGVLGQIRHQLPQLSLLPVPEMLKPLGGGWQGAEHQN